jgi:putative ABC transport system substrate-binding protein
MKSGRAASLIIVALGMLVAPLGAEAQQVKRDARIGIITLARTGDVPTQTNFDALRQGLREHGWVEGKTIAFEYRWADGRYERLPDIAAELVRLKVDIVVTSTTPAIQAVQQATKTIPIVTMSADPVGTGLVASLARPGGNITGLSIVGPQLTAKQLELVKEALPSVKRVAFVWDPANPALALRFQELELAARTVGLEIESLEVRTPIELRNALEAASSKHAGALIVPPPIALAHRERVTDLATKNRLPTMYENREPVEAGGLMSYGANIPDLWRRAATYVDKILKGAKPGDLPIEQPTKFELVVNLKTAKALGLTIPSSLLLRADQVIQ